MSGRTLITAAMAGIVTASLSGCVETVGYYDDGYRYYDPVFVDRYPNYPRPVIIDRDRFDHHRREVRREIRRDRRQDRREVRQERREDRREARRERREDRREDRRERREDRRDRRDR